MKQKSEKKVYPNYDLKSFERTQVILARHIVEKECGEPYRIAGVYVAYADKAYAACVVCGRDSEILEEKSAVSKIHFPYLSTFFSFREFPPILKALSGAHFDLLFVHGHGEAHPRFFGLACHVGLFVQKPTIGIASRPICGEIVGGKVIYEEKTVGIVSGKHIVSVGNLITLAQAYKYSMLFSGNDFPFPLTLAHDLAEKLKNTEIE